jgi:hypothetical protein
MLQYLVRSKVRRRLLVLLWGQNKRGSVGELAELAGVAFAGVHAELKAMLRAELVVSERDGGKEVFSANLEHPDAKPLRALVAGAGRKTVPQPAKHRVLKRKLVALGAPLRGVEPLAVKPSEQMPTLAQGVLLARSDAAVARSLPLCFWMLRESLDVKALAALTFRAEDRHALGFILELTGELGGDRRLVGIAESLRDRRMTSLRDFFHSSQRHDVVRDFPMAAKWGFRMNTDLDSFRTMFGKFATA